MLIFYGISNQTQWKIFSKRFYEEAKILKNYGFINTLNKTIKYQFHVL